ncbi:hypothetical protein HYR54_02345 [Candidatus Acetothermia bacterium]|nr:hypothetical protein [Candidatus Acetothermia bacterium]MBI3460835.1 hypothetical protein [Candidatus Acetothermia bacterium]
MKNARSRWSSRWVVVLALVLSSFLAWVLFAGAHPSMLDRRSPQNCEPKPVYDPNSLPLLAQAKAATPSVINSHSIMARKSWQIPMAAAFQSYGIRAKLTQEQRPR